MIRIMRMLPANSIIIAGWNITDASRNGGVGYFRQLCTALAQQGIRTAFLQPRTAGSGDSPGGHLYQVLQYQTPLDIPALLAAFSPDRLILKYIDAAPDEDVLLDTLLRLGSPVWLVDGDAPDTLARNAAFPTHPLRRQLPRCAGVLLASGGPTAAQEYRELGMRQVELWYAAAALSPLQHHIAPCEGSGLCWQP